jgi:hypothetical protein
MKYVKHYRISRDDIIQVEYSDEAKIPDGIEVSAMPFPDLTIVKSLGHGDDNPMVNKMPKGV